MSNQENIIQTLSISELLDINNKYIIPIYQRNYAWGETEIKQLIQDIIDKQIVDLNSYYYLGSLIVDEKVKNSEVSFEIIDGQQRHTTLTLINAYLNRDNNEKKSNLFFDARPLVRKQIETLYKSYNEAKKSSIVDDSVKNIISGIEIIDSFFSSGKDLRDNAIIEDNFKKYFLNNVIIIRVGVPKDTDINHYFEIMNTRGIQLEKHQILKSAFIEQIKNDEKLSKEFAKIWDACSFMDTYIYKKTLIELQKEVNSESNQQEKDVLPKRTLLNILNGGISTDKQKIEEDRGAKYASIIDFPNFLLQTLRLFKNDDSISLDDKNLLESFGYKDKTMPDAIEFINFLLKVRTLFDKYFIKREIDESGEIKWRTLKPSENQENDYLINTYSSNKVLMIQSMFQVSFPTNSYKNWLLEQLEWIIENESVIDENEDKYFEFCFEKSHKYLKERSSDKDWIYKGVNINHYIFNYIDFILWKKYDEKVKGNNPINEETLIGKISEQRKYFESFRFTQRSSIEHIHPQSKIYELLEVDEKERKHKNNILNNIGNLCLISRSANSKYNDYNFQAKKEQYEKKNTTESLKQAIIYSYDSWNTIQIQEHEKEILALIEHHTNLTPKT